MCTGSLDLGLSISYANNLDDCSETIELFLAAMYYEIQDDLENLYDEFHIPSELEGIQAHYFIEDKIRNILKEGV